MLLPSIVLARVEYHNKMLLDLQASWDAGDCFFFRFAGVSEADPVKTGDQWFAMSRSQFGAKDAYAMLLSAKLAGRPVSVITSGNLSCGYAQVLAIYME
jgi:hypothetical protein